MEYTATDIKNQINSMIYLNVISYSVLSGCGNCSVPDSQDIAELQPILNKLSPENRPYNIFFTDSLYKKCMPQYEAEIENPYDFKSFKWVDNKTKKIIDIEVMANSIITCCGLIERILTFDIQLDNTSLIVYILQRTALKQAEFIIKYLKVGNVFYNGEDVAEENSEELHIQIASDNPDRVSQFAVFHAFSTLVQLSSYNLGYSSCNDEALLDELNALPNLLESFVENISQCSTKELSLVGMHLAEIYKKSGIHIEISRKTLNKIAKELGQRITDAGALQRNRDSEETASPSTAANCLNLLSQLAYMFSSRSCLEASRDLYAQLSSIWDNEGKAFKIRSSNKQKYNIKDAAAILAALYSYKAVESDSNNYDKIQMQIISFSETAFIDSGLFNGQCYPILQDNKMELITSKKCEKMWVPVFNKAFEYKISKKKYYCDADIFRADYVMPACSMLLNSINN